MKLIGNIINRMKFLLISRKYSVGYVQFIRGYYKPEKTDKMMHLFRQMSHGEIEKIRKSLELEDGFEYLWNDFWGTKSDNQHRHKDKVTSKKNYNILKNNGVNGPEINLQYIVSVIKIDYDNEEWGFPKGRRNRNESEKDCAIREFKEESGLEDDDFEIIENIDPLVERLTGTNGVEYKHVYYVAELKNTKIITSSDKTESQKNEIGDIKFLDFDQAQRYIREYHLSRKYILEMLFCYYVESIVTSFANEYSNIN